MVELDINNKIEDSKETEKVEDSKKITIAEMMKLCGEAVIQDE